MKETCCIVDIDLHTDDCRDVMGAMDAEYVEIARRRIAYWQGQYIPADNTGLPMWEVSDV